MVFRKTIFTKSIKQGCALLLSLLLLAGMMPVIAMPAAALEGSGTKESPFVVTTFAELKYVLNTSYVYSKLYLQLGNDITYTSSSINDHFDLSSSADVDLDLNGRVLDITSNVDNQLFILTNTAKLRVYDSKGSIGTIKWTRSKDDSPDNAIFLIKGDNSRCVLTIDSGYYVGTNVNCIHSYAGTGTVIINGGTFAVGHQGGNRPHYHNVNTSFGSKVSIIINDGVFTAKETCAASICGDITINGGYFTVSSADALKAVDIHDTGRAEINGGTFRNSTANTKYCPISDYFGKAIINAATIEMSLGCDYFFYKSPSVDNTIMRIDGNRIINYVNESTNGKIGGKTVEIFRPRAFEMGVNGKTFSPAYGSTQYVEALSSSVPVSFKCSPFPTWVKNAGYTFIAAMHATDYPNLLYANNKTEASGNLSMGIGEKRNVYVQMKIMRNGSTVLTNTSGTVTVSRPIPTAQNLRWDGKVAKWDAVVGAEKYNINLYKDGSVYSSVYTVDANNQYDFSKRIEQLGTGKYKFNVTVVVSGRSGPTSGNSAEYNYTSPSDIKTLQSIAITKPATKLTYNAGESFDPSGMVVTATYSNGSSAAVTSYTVTGGNNMSAGRHVVTVSYTEKGVTVTTEFFVDAVTVDNRAIVNAVEITTSRKNLVPVVGGQIFKSVITHDNVTVKGEPAYLSPSMFHWEKVEKGGKLTVMSDGAVVTEGTYVLTAQLRIDNSNTVNGKNGNTHKLGETVTLKVNGVTWEITGDTYIGTDYSYVFVSSPKMTAKSTGTPGKIIPGDIDGINGVDVNDAIYALYSAMLPDLYPMNQRGDYNGDGRFDIDDAIYLLMYTMLPDLYQLSPLSV